MAQSKLNDLAGKFGKGGPPGLGLGLKLLAFGGAAVYGVSQSMYTGKYQLKLPTKFFSSFCVPLR